MTTYLLLALMAITFVNRFAFFTEVVRYTPGPKVRRFLGYSSYAVLTAIWAPIVFRFEPEAGLSIAGLDYFLGALIAAVLTIAKVRSIVVVLISAASFFTLRFFLS